MRSNHEMFNNEYKCHLMKIAYEFVDRMKNDHARNDKHLSMRLQQIIYYTECQNDVPCNILNSIAKLLTIEIHNINIHGHACPWSYSEIIVLQDVANEMFRLAEEG